MQERVEAARARTGRAAVREAGISSTSISELDIKQQIESEVSVTKEAIKGSKKLHEANRKGKDMEQELRALCTGVIDRLEKIGLQVAESAEFRGKEKTFAFFGKLFPSLLNKAQALRLQRLETATVDQAIKEVQAYVEETISELGAVEAEYGENVKQYAKTIDTVLSKLREATPKQLESERRRAELEGRYNALDLELRSGTIQQAERPAKEAEFEVLKRQLEECRLQVMEYLTIVTEAQRAMPTLQQSKDAASRSIESIHGMRRDLLEKWQNLSVILENAMTAVRARAKLERYQAVNPAMNRAVEVVSDHNIAVAGAAMEIAAEQIKNAAMSPERSRELLQHLTQHVLDFIEEFAEVEQEAKEGVRKE